MPSAHSSSNIQLLVVLLLCMRRPVVPGFCPSMGAVATCCSSGEQLHGERLAAVCVLSAGYNRHAIRMCVPGACAALGRGVEWRVEVHLSDVERHVARLLFLDSSRCVAGSHGASKAGRGIRRGHLVKK